MLKLDEQIQKILNEFAYDRKEAIRKLDNVAHPLAYHICKIALWGSQNDEWLDHWAEEIYNFVTPLADIRLRNGKKLKESDYIKYLFDPYLENEQDLADLLKSVYFTCVRNKQYPVDSNSPDYKEAFNYFLLLRSTLISHMYVQKTDAEIKKAIRLFSDRVRSTS